MFIFLINVFLSEGNIFHYICFSLEQIECSSISDYAVKIVKANKLDDGVYITSVPSLFNEK